MPSIQSLSSAVLDVAKERSIQKNVFHLLTFISASLSIFLNGSSLYVLATTAFLTEISSWLLSISISRKKSLGQDLLRLNILQKAFGSKMKVDTSYLKSKVSEQEFIKAKFFENSDYYATGNECPEKRLVDIIQESCFWTQHLYQSCQKRSIKTSALLGIIIIILIVTCLSLVKVDTDYSIPRLSILFLMFLPLWSLIDDAVSYGVANRKLTDIDYRLSRTIYDTPNILLIFAEYNVTTSNAPLIPQKVYESEKLRLNELWSERISNVAES